MENKITSIRVTADTKYGLKQVKKYPRETDEETLIRLIEKELKITKELPPAENGNALNTQNTQKEENVK